MSTRYDVILFDLDDTLLEFDPAEKRAMERTFAQFGIPLNEDTEGLYDRINAAQWRALELGQTSLPALKVDRFRLFLDELGFPTDPQAVADAFIGHLGRGIYPVRGAAELCRRLYQRYRLVVVSNGIRDVQVPRVWHSPLAPYIEALVVSEDAGVGKPDPAFFEYACASIGYYTKERMLIVGDSLSSDILGGIRFGIDTCWANFARSANGSGAAPKYEIGSLEELESIL